MLMSSNRGNVQQALTNFLSMVETEDPVRFSLPYQNERVLINPISYQFKKKG